MGQKILFPTDGSEAAEKVLDVLMNRVRSGDEVIILHVLPDPIGVDWQTDYNPVELEKNLKEAGERIVEHTAERVNRKCETVGTELVEGDPGETIVDRAEQGSVDEIFMGRRGRGRATELLLGSVSHYVTHHAPCPVTVVPG